MKSNTLVILGFAIICLVNLSTGTRVTPPAKPVPPPPEMKMAETPLAPVSSETSTHHASAPAVVPSL